MKRLFLIATLLGLWLPSAPSPGAPGPAASDGDPLDNYVFTGEVPIEKYVEQGRTRVYRLGLWTIQQFQHFDAFRPGPKTWDLAGNRKVRVGIFYGTWPKWASEYSYDSWLSTPRFREYDSPVPEFELVLDTFKDSEPAPQLFAVDCTDSGAITLHIARWNGGASGGMSGMLLRLSGTDPASANVEVLWEGQYEKFVDLDGNGEPEIIDSDWAHSYATYLPYKGISTTALLDWDPELGRYRAVGGDLYRQALATLRRRDSNERSRSSWIQELRDRIREDRAEWSSRNQATVQISLASSISELLWGGEAEEARAMFEDFPLPSYHGGYQIEWTADEWWAAYVAGCQGSKYWPDLCEAYPALRNL